MATARDYGMPDMVATITVAAIAANDDDLKRQVLSVLSDNQVSVAGQTVIKNATFFRAELERVANLFVLNPLDKHYAPAIFPNGASSVSIGEAIEDSKRQLRQAFDKVFHGLIILAIILLVVR
jgi:hypothetical protein